MIIALNTSMLRMIVSIGNHSSNHSIMMAYKGDKVAINLNKADLGDGVPTCQRAINPIRVRKKLLCATSYRYVASSSSMSSHIDDDRIGTIQVIHCTGVLCATRLVDPPSIYNPSNTSFFFLRLVVPLFT
jgi:hypothetical protein